MLDVFVVNMKIFELMKHFHFIGWILFRIEIKKRF
jgi:hypothetical protein